MNHAKTTTTPVLASGMALLAARVPLSLLCDLAEPFGPDSVGIWETETKSGRVIVLPVGAAPVSMVAS